jgi:hypothetical protein
MNFLKPSSMGWTSSVKAAANLVPRTGKVKCRDAQMRIGITIYRYL